MSCGTSGSYFVEPKYISTSTAWSFSWKHIITINIVIIFSHDHHHRRRWFSSGSPSFPSKPAHLLPASVLSTRQSSKLRFIRSLGDLTWHQLHSAKTENPLSDVLQGMGARASCRNASLRTVQGVILRRLPASFSQFCCKRSGIRTQWPSTISWHPFRVSRAGQSIYICTIKTTETKLNSHCCDHLIVVICCDHWPGWLENNWILDAYDWGCRPKYRPGQFPKVTTAKKQVPTAGCLTVLSRTSHLHNLSPLRFMPFKIHQCCMSNLVWALLEPLRTCQNIPNHIISNHILSAWG